MTHYHLALVSYQLLERIRRAVTDFAIIGAVLAVLHVGYTLLGKLLGLEDVL